MADLDDAWNYAISSFNPYQCDFTTLEVKIYFVFKWLTGLGLLHLKGYRGGGRLLKMQGGREGLSANYVMRERGSNRKI